MPRFVHITGDYEFENEEAARVHAEENMDKEDWIEYLNYSISFDDLLDWAMEQEKFWNDYREPIQEAKECFFNTFYEPISEEENEDEKD